MAHYYGKHKVADYDAWRPYFDGDAARRESVGVTTVNVMRSAADPNEVHFIFDVPDMPAFAAIMQDPQFGEIMHKAGVLEQPSIYKLEAL